MKKDQIELTNIFIFLLLKIYVSRERMRVVLLHCGARRANVRVQASEFLALVLRLTWECYGSFLRVRVPLLAVQSEVMDRIVTTAAKRYYREQRKMSIAVEYLSSEGAEGSLATLWRTIDRLQNNSVSQNVAFRTAEMRLAEKMKTLFKAYIGANALAISNRRRMKSPITTNDKEIENSLSQLNAKSRREVKLRKIISKSAYSRKFVGLFSEKKVVIHNEAVEDAFLAAADVFSPTGEIFTLWQRCLSFVLTNRCNETHPYIALSNLVIKKKSCLFPG